MIIIKQKTKKILEKAVKVCSDCGKEFLGIAIDGGVDPAHTWIATSETLLYPLKCGKCPDCAEKCFNKIVGFSTKNIKEEDYNNTIKIPCENEFWTSEEWWEYKWGVDCYSYFHYYTDLSMIEGVDETGATYLLDLLELFEGVKSNNK